MPSATAALSVPKEERDYLGGWSAQASDVCANITHLPKKLVFSSMHGHWGDPIAESETSSQFDEFLTANGEDPQEKTRCIGLLEHEGYEYVAYEPASLEAQVVELVSIENGRWILMTSHESLLCRRQKKGDVPRTLARKLSGPIRKRRELWFCRGWKKGAKSASWAKLVSGPYICWVLVNDSRSGYLEVHKS